MKNTKVRNESGQVSIITVIAFILLFSVLVISFSRIMVAASRQAVNDELAASAKAAADAGIEDAKRILSYCAAGGGADCDMLDKPLEDSDCTTISSKNSLMNALQRQVVSGSSVKVGNGVNQEEYLCLKMTMSTPDFLESLSSDGNSDGRHESIVIPLKFVDRNNVPTMARTIRIQWHNTSSGSSGSASPLNGSDLPPTDKWDGTAPAVVRAEFVAVPAGSFRFDQLAENMRAVTLRPSTAENAFGAPKVVGNAFNLDYWSWAGASEPRSDSDTKFPLMQIRCNGSDGYACSVEFTIPRTPGGGGTDYLFDTNQYNYYLRLQAVYQNTNVRVSAKDGSGRNLYFSKVQAAVDVTGRAGESLKRLATRLNPVSPDPDDEWWPDYAVDSAGKICKRMTIKDVDGTDYCDD